MKPHPLERASRATVKRLIRLLLAPDGVRAPGLSAAIKAFGGRPWTVEVRWVGGAEMRRINRRFRGKDRMTDILSFGVPPEFARASGALGELVICGPVLTRQAKEHAHSERHEMRVLVIHGLLHLLGFDHEKGAKQARQMAAAEAALLRVLVPSQKVPRGLIARSGARTNARTGTRTIARTRAIR